ncbi:MAG TPA: phosphorylase [Stenomitos sp.]
MTGLHCIFVPQGAEFKAVQRGLKGNPKVLVYPIPMGPMPVEAYLQQWCQTSLPKFDAPPSVVLMGLCGGLISNLQVGDWVLYRNCIDARPLASVPPPSACSLACSKAVFKTVQERLGNSVTIVTAAMCDRLVHRAADKQALALRCQAEAVDMEGYAFLAALQGTGIEVGMVRVVSDDAQHDIPDLSTAMTANGTLDPLALTACFVRSPLQAARLIRGSLRGLKQLERVTGALFNSTESY